MSISHQGEEIVVWKGENPYFLSMAHSPSERERGTTSKRSSLSFWTMILLLIAGVIGLGYLITKLL